MSYHLFGSILTAEGIASNNRGENAGNMATLQKIMRGDAIHTTVSAESIRYAMREYWHTRTDEGLQLNRPSGEVGGAWQDAEFADWQRFADDDLMGFMNAKKDTTKRRGRFEITRAVSTRPWVGEVMFSVASVGAQNGSNANPVPYSTEVHTTRYQYLFALTPGDLAEPTRALLALDAVQNLHRVAGNHSRYLYDFSPEGVILRWTHDPAPRMMYCFEEDERLELRLPRIIDGLRSGDLDASELIVGGPALASAREVLRELSVQVHDGIKSAFAEAHERITESLSAEAV